MVDHGRNQPTRRLHQEDSRLLSFEAEVLSCARRTDGALEVVLDQTAFYVEGGGQPSDTGCLDGRQVDRLEFSQDQVVHLLVPRNSEDDGPPMESRIQGRIDGERRLDLIQQHTGQHLLSRAFMSVGCGRTVSVHLGLEECTLDLEGEKPTPEQLREAQEEADRRVLENRPIRIRWIPQEEMDSLGIRWDPAHDRDIHRVIEIEDYDRSACGGTHARSTGEVGPVLVLGAESVRGKWRIRFVAGRRALGRLREGTGILDDLAREFTVGWADLPAAVLGAREEARALSKRLRRLHRERGEWRGERLRASCGLGTHGLPAIGEWLGDSPLEELRAAAGRILEVGPAVVLLGGEEDGQARWVAASSAEGGEGVPGARDLLQNWLGEIAGKGGGSQSMAQGVSRLPAGAEEADRWRQLLRRVVGVD